MEQIQRGPETEDGTAKTREQKETVRISVRSLVEFILRSGDIDSRRGGFADKDAMQEGSRIHRKIQGRMKGDYRAEVPLSCSVDEGSYQIVLEGRADGIEERDGGARIDEIKGVYMDLDRLEEPVPVHLAQAMCYGYMYLSQQKLDAISVQVTYCQLETEEIRRFEREYSAEELEVWFQGLIHEYVKWGITCGITGSAGTRP